MKKYTSVFDLLARQSFYKILVLMGIMAALEIGLFCAFSLDATNLYGALWATGAEVIFPIFMFSLCFLLGLPARQKHSKVAYTLMRLRISRKAVGWVCSLYSILMLLLFFMVQALILWGLSLWHGWLHPQSTGSMTLFITAHRYSLLNLLFPVDNWLAYLWFLVIVILVGSTWAWDSPLLKPNAKLTFPHPIYMYFLMQYIREFYGGSPFSIFFVIISVVFMCSCLVMLLKGGNRDE